MTVELNRLRSGSSRPERLTIQSASADESPQLDEDGLLVLRCQQGDDAAFEVLFLEHRDRLYRLCLHRLGDKSEAEDAVQEAFIRAWRALPGFTGERRFYPWLSVIASNLCTDIQRKRARYNPVAEEELDQIVPPVMAEQEALFESRGEKEILARALGRLSERHRQVLELREGRNWTYKQIATFSGVEVSTVETLLFRARRSLRREFMTIARAEGALGVVLVPWYLLRRMLVRLPGRRHLVHPYSFSTPSSSSGAEHPAAKEVTAEGWRAGATGAPAGGWPSFASSSWFSTLSGLSSSVQPSLVGSGLAAAAVAAIVMASLGGGGHSQPVAGRTVPARSSSAVLSPADRVDLQAAARASSPEPTTGSRTAANGHTSSAGGIAGQAASESSYVARGTHQRPHSNLPPLPSPNQGGGPAKALKSLTGSSGGVGDPRSLRHVSRTVQDVTGTARHLTRGVHGVTGTVRHLTLTVHGVTGTVADVTGTVADVTGTVAHVTGNLGHLGGTVAHVTGILGHVTLGHLGGTVSHMSGVVVHASTAPADATGSARRATEALGHVTGTVGRGVTGTVGNVSSVVGGVAGTAGSVTGVVGGGAGITGV